MPDTAVQRVLPPGADASSSIAGADNEQHAAAGGAGYLDAGVPADGVTVVRRRVHAVPTTVAAVSTGLLVLAALTLGLVGELSGLGALKHDRDQVTRFATFRADLANGVAPVGPTDDQGRVLTEGTSVGVLSIPDLGLIEVIGEGSSSRVTMAGLGHRRDTVLPGQAGVSVIVGRRAAYGAPFAALAHLAVGSQVSVTTGQGAARYVVRTVRRAGSTGPTPLQSGSGRLVLVTADGPAYLPTGVVYVDADLVGAPQLTPPAVWSSSGLPAADQLMAGDTGALVPLVLWAELLLLLVLALTWAVLRWGRWQTWVVGVPTVAAVGLVVADQFARLLPNLL